MSLQPPKFEEIIKKEQPKGQSTPLDIDEENKKLPCKTYLGETLEVKDENCFEQDKGEWSPGVFYLTNYRILFIHGTVSSYEENQLITSVPLTSISNWKRLVANRRISRNTDIVLNSV
jgi:hypothetical protein